MIETIPRHKEFNKNALEAKKLKQVSAALVYCYSSYHIAERLRMIFSLKTEHVYDINWSATDQQLS